MTEVDQNKQLLKYATMGFIIGLAVGVYTRSML